MIPSQMLKGTLSGCVLAIIARRETYGYEIAETLSDCGFGHIAEGTVYPLLLRLERNGLISAQYRASELGPQRKYFRLTEAGEEELRQFEISMRELERAVNNVLGEENREQT